MIAWTIRLSGGEICAPRYVDLRQKVEVFSLMEPDEFHEQRKVVWASMTHFAMPIKCTEEQVRERAEKESKEIWNERTEVY